MKAKRFKAKKRIKEEAKRIKRRVRKVKVEVNQEAAADSERWYPDKPSKILSEPNFKRIDDNVEYSKVRFLLQRTRFRKRHF